jgi:hypothetical protein
VTIPTLRRDAFWRGAFWQTTLSSGENFQPNPSKKCFAAGTA